MSVYTGKAKDWPVAKANQLYLKFCRRNEHAVRMGWPLCRCAKGFCAREQFVTGPKGD